MSSTRTGEGGGQPSPDVSVVIPTRDRSTLLPAAIDSCAMAHGLRVKVIVVDDGSVDGTPRVLDEMARRLAGGPATLVCLHQPPGGACTARNLGLEHAGGEFVKFLDSDDWLLPGALAREVKEARSSGADVVVTGWRVETVTADGKVAGGHDVSAPNLEHGIDDMLLGAGPCTSAALYRRAFLDTHTLRWDAQWTKAQDWAWAVTVCLAGARFHTLDLLSSVYVQHGRARITSQGDSLQRSVAARQQILEMVEQRLRAQDALGAERRLRLARYIFRDAVYLARHDPAAWRETWKRCLGLYPAFRPDSGANRLHTVLLRALGGYAGTVVYAKAARLVRAVHRP